MAAVRSASLMTAPIYQVKAEFFRTLGHPARIRVLEILQGGERPVAELIPDGRDEPADHRFPHF